MSMSIIVTCEDGKGIHSDNDICLIGTFMDDLDKIAKKKKLRPLTPYVLDVEAMGEEDDAEFLDPKDAIATLEGIATILKDKAGGASFMTDEDIECVLEEIPDLVSLLKKALKRKQRVRLMFV